MFAIELVTTENLLKELERRNIPETFKASFLFGYGTFDTSWARKYLEYLEIHGTDTGGT